MTRENLRAGVHNLLFECGGLHAGQRLLIVHEPDSESYFEPGMADIVAQYARLLGLEPHLWQVPFAPLGGEVCDALSAEMARADGTLFLARLGDQIRFCPSMRDLRPIMCYALDCASLASDFGRTPHCALVDLKDTVNRAFESARNIRITCPLGSDLVGTCQPDLSAAGADVAVRRFPMLVFAPVTGESFSGTIVQGGFIVGTGSHFYEPYALGLNAPVRISVQAGRMTKLDGAPDDVRRVEAHYERIGRMFGVDPYRVHSWHSGIHPGCAFAQPAAHNFQRWSGSAFGNPRLTHFHTCGETAPGEICLNLLDPTIALDGVPVWSEGRFDPMLIRGGAQVLAAHPGLDRLFAQPDQRVGQGPGERLFA